MVAAAIGIGTAVAGVGTSLIGSSQAAGAAKDAANLQQRTAAANAARAAPFVTIGANAGNQLLYENTRNFGLDGDPNYLQLARDAMPGQMTQAELERTPGYQWQLNQGLQATQQSAAAKGLGASGAALKGAATFATGLADSNYQTQFNNAQTRSQDYLNLNTANQGNAMNKYNRLSGTTTMGANAANQVATNAVTSANNAGGFLTAGGNAAAAGTVGAGNAVTGAAQNYLLYSQLQGQNYNAGVNAITSQAPSFGQTGAQLLASF